MEQVRIFYCTVQTYVNCVTRHSGFNKLCHIGGLEINEDLCPLFPDEFLGKLSPNLIAYSITTCAGTGTDVCNHVVLLAAQLPDHLLYGPLNNQGRCPAPPGVDCCNHPLLNVHDEYRDTIRNANTQIDFRNVSDQTITSRITSGNSNTPHNIAMHLHGDCETIKTNRKRVKKQFPV